LVFIKKVDNTDPGDGDTVGGDDWDKFDDYFDDVVNALTGKVNSTFEVMASKFKIRDLADETKELVNNVAAIAAGTTRTITWPNKNIDFGNVIVPHYIPCLTPIPDGTVAFPDIHPLATAATKVTSSIFPDGASVGIMDIKPQLPLPSDLHSTPNLKAHFELFPLDTEATNVNTRFTALSKWTADGEDLDLALVAEAEETVAMPTTINNTVIYTVALDAGTVAANDTGLVQLKRDPTDAVDVYANSVGLKVAWLTCDRKVVI